MLGAPQPAVREADGALARGGGLPAETCSPSPRPLVQRAPRLPGRLRGVLWSRGPSASVPAQPQGVGTQPSALTIKSALSPSGSVSSHPFIRVSCPSCTQHF